MSVFLLSDTTFKVSPPIIRGKLNLEAISTNDETPGTVSTEYFFGKCSKIYT